jgi:ubiquinol-cytochrome c reductase iron-sulfur subunit
MSDNDRDQENAPEQRPTPHRVIGTPPPSHGVLADLGQAGQAGRGAGRGTEPYSPGEAEAPELRELPADPPDPIAARRWERTAAALFILAMIAGAGFIAAYVGLEVHDQGNVLVAVLRSNLGLGTSLGVAMLAMGAGFTIWVRRVMPPAELTEERHPLASSPEDRAAFAETFIEGAETSQITKRPLLRRTLIAATVPVAVAPLVLLRDMGPLPGTSLRHTVWRKGMRLLVYATNRPITAAEFNSAGGMITVVPEGFQDNQEELAKATSIIIKMEPGQLQAPTNLNWTVDNIVAYSKICTHVGCPAALYESTTHRILCPCHQSTFDATRGATVTFGPAPRPLPQLPITTDAQGYLVAQHDFTEPVGPSFWERG